MTKMKVLGLAACIAWGGATLSAATAADALVATTQQGPFAAVGGHYVVEPRTFCRDFYYRQTMRFLGNGCNSGFCSDDTGASYTDIVYSPGRKLVSPVDIGCGPEEGGSGGMTFFGLGSCNC
jgi:hypothetical protein